MLSEMSFAFLMITILTTVGTLSLLQITPSKRQQFKTFLIVSSDIYICISYSVSIFKFYFNSSIFIYSVTLVSGSQYSDATIPYTTQCPSSPHQLFHPSPHLRILIFLLHMNN